MFAGQVRNGTLQIGFLPSPNAPWQIFPVGPCPLGERVPVEIVYEPSKDSTGYIKVTVGPRVMLDFAGANNTGGNDAGPLSTNDAGGYWKQGIYDCWNSVGALPGTADDSLSGYINDLSIYD